MTCGVGHRRGLALALLWLWPAAVAPIRPLSLETSICCRCSPKKKKKRRRGRPPSLSLNPTHPQCPDIIKMAGTLFYFLTAVPETYGSSWAWGQVKSDLQLLATARATATLHPSHICNICHRWHHRLWQCQILNPLSKAGCQTHILTDTILGS